MHEAPIHSKKLKHEGAKLKGSATSNFTKALLPCKIKMVHFLKEVGESLLKTKVLDKVQAF